MADPFVDGFIRGYQLKQTPADKDAYTKEFVLAAEQSLEPNQLYPILLEINRHIGIDTTSHLSTTQAPNINPIPKEQVEANFERLVDKAPWTRRVTAKIAGVGDFFQKNSEFGAAGALNIILAAIPGEQALEKDLTANIDGALAELGANTQSRSTLDQLRIRQNALSDAYRKTKLPWGWKGTLEVIFDPLNLIGAGLPAKLGKAAPLLKPLMIPLNVIDQAPAAVVEKVLTTPFKSVVVTQNMANIVPSLKPIIGKKFGLGELPAIRALKEPSVLAKVSNAAKQVRSMLEGEFGAKVFSELPSDTAEVFSNMKKFPNAADPRSMHGIMAHLLNDAPGKDWEPIWNSLTALKPREAIDVVTAMAAATEERAIRRGGTLLGGEVVEGISTRRQKKITSWLEQVQLDAGYAKGIAHGIDKHLMKFEATWINKIEPNIVRPWSLAYLYTMGYLPTNMIEDVGISILGMGVNPFGVNDKTYKAIWSGLERPQFLDNAERIARGEIDVRSGLYARKPSKSVISQAGDIMGGWVVRRTSIMSAAIQRASLTQSFSEQFMQSIRKRGVTDAEISNIRDFIKTELPIELQDIRKEIEPIVWSMLTTGDSATVREVSELFTSGQHLIRSQRELLKEIVELPTDTRTFVMEKLAKGETISVDNVVEFRNGMRAGVMEHHRWTEEGIRSESEQMLRNLKVREPKSPDEAMSLFRSIHAAGERLSDLPREVNARGKLLGREATTFEERTKIRDESLRIVDEVIGDIRKDYSEIIERAQPGIEKQLTKLATGDNVKLVKESLKRAFDAKREVGENLQKTWTEYRRRIIDLFEDATQSHDKAFWESVHTIGDEIWESERVFRAKQARIADDNWMNVFTNLRPSLNQSDKPFLTDTLFSMWAETAQRIDDFRTDLFRLEGLRASVPTSGINTLERKIGTTKEIISAEIVARRELEGQLKTIQGQTPRFKQPTIIDEYDANLRILSRELNVARKFGMSPQVESVQQTIRDLRLERTKSVSDLIPPTNQAEYQALTEIRDQLGRQRGGLGQTQLRDLKRTEVRISQIEEAAGRGDTIREGLLISNVSRTMVGDVAAKVHAQLGRIPKTIDETRIALRALATTGDESAQGLAQLIEANADEAEDVVQRVFASAISLGEKADITGLQMKILEDIQIFPDAVPTETINELIEKGFVERINTLSGGRWHLAPTDSGRAILAASPEVSPDIRPLLEGMPTPVKPIDSMIEFAYERVDDYLDKAIKVADNPPLPLSAEAKVREYTGKVASYMDSLPAFQTAAKEARKEASVNAIAKFNKFFINYDNQSTFDFMMQRLFPFWMYDSRRWPRLARMVAKRPVLGKYFAQSMGDWDYGYVDVGGSGFQYSAMRGVGSSQIKSAFAKDFPDFHDDWRGTKETILEDWLGRGGFPVNPLISTASLIVSGRGAEALPPPLSSLMYGFVAAGVEIPQPFADIAFSSRFLQAKIDRVLTSEMGLNVPEIRSRMERDDEVGEEAKANFDLARRVASRNLLLEQQTSVLRYNPKIRQDFKLSAAEAVKEIGGISDEDAVLAKRLGIPLTALFPFSGPQRKALRDIIPNYDVFAGESISLRPKEEQVQLLRIDEFWDRTEVMREEFRVREVVLSEDYVEGNLGGPELRRKLSRIKSERAIAFATLQAEPRFQQVPLTIEQRIEWITRHGSPPPLVHPIDEMRERFHSIDPEAEEFINAFSGETDWNKYFEARNAIIEEYPEEMQRVFTQVRLVEATPAERALEAARPWLNQYQGVRNRVFEAVGRLDPNLPGIYRQYLQLKALSTRQENPTQSQQFEKAALLVLQENPLLMLAERIVRALRKNLIEGNTEMARVHRLWISSNKNIPLSLGR